jgi:hypothetical protein
MLLIPPACPFKEIFTLIVRIVSAPPNASLTSSAIFQPPIVPASSGKFIDSTIIKVKNAINKIVERISINPKTILIIGNHFCFLV